MAYTFLSRFRIRAEREAEFVDLAREMERQVHREPGTLAFKFYKLDEPQMYAVYEAFVDQAADEAHMATEHGKPLIAAMIACMDGGYAREMLHDLPDVGER